VTRRLSVILGPASAADLPALAALAAATLPEPWSEPGFGAELARPEARVWLARSPAGELLGYVVAHRVLDELSVVSLAVDERQRRRGTGRALLEHALAREPGLRVVHLEVRSKDAGTQAFYARLGFRPVGRRPGFYAGREDAILLARTLSGTDCPDPPGATLPRGERGAAELVNP